MASEKTHSIVTDECLLRTNHIGVPVAYKGAEGLLIRYIPNCGHKQLLLTLEEARDCIDENYPSEDL
jgi:hypothetical protein